jgi:hypothetical protein
VIWVHVEPVAGPPRESASGSDDIGPIGRPGTSAGQWHDPAAAVEQLRDWAERYTMDTITRYLRDQRRRWWSSRLSRAAAMTFAVLGGIVPLIANNLTWVEANVGYALLALAAGGVAFDHFFGFSAGWVRCVVTAQALQGRLARFHLAWAAWQATEAGVLSTSDPAQPATTGVRAALDLIDELVTDVLRLTEWEATQRTATSTSVRAATARPDSTPLPVVLPQLSTAIGADITAPR